ncbi:hypothetical protein TCSYLVIO_005606, partial [Trypanosoma cruzi]
PDHHRRCPVSFTRGHRAVPPEFEGSAGNGAALLESPYY